MPDDRKDETQEQVKKQKVSPRFLLCCGMAFRMKCIGVRDAYAAIVLTKNGFTAGEADEAIEQVKHRWDKLTHREQADRRRAVQMKQLLKDSGLRRSR
jgi:hypothetical protein